MNGLKRFYRNYFLGRYYHVRRYFDSLELDGNYYKKDLDIIETLKGKAAIELKAVRRFQFISIALYVALYFSIVNFLLADFVVIGNFIEAARGFVTFIGAPIFIVAQLFVTRANNIRFEKLSLYTSHLIAYSVKR